MATCGYDGAFHEPTRIRGVSSEFVPPPPSTAPSQQSRMAALTTSLKSKSATKLERSLRGAQWSPTSNAFTGTSGHHSFGGERSAPARPPLADVQHLVTRHPCDATPGPGKYDADPVKPTFTSYEREAATVGRIRRSAVTGGLAWLGQTSIQPRMAPAVPHFASPGPGAYASERSDFDTLWRPVGVRGGKAADPRGSAPAFSTSRAGLAREDHSVRGATVCFGTASRSSAYPTPGQSEAARFGVHAPRPPAATNYSPLPHQDIVYLSMNRRGTSPPPYKGKVGQLGAPPKVSVFELSRR